MTNRFPVFIVGSPRSGTSAMVSALLGVGYHGFLEGNFLPLISSVNEIVDRHFSIFSKGDPYTMVNLIDRVALKSSIAAILASRAVELNPITPWLDKSGNPQMIEAIPYLLETWPEAMFIFSKRRGIENIISRLNKFPTQNFEYHCKDWAQVMRTWRETRTKLDPLSFLEMDQQTLITAPTTASNKLANFLNLSDTQSEALSSIFTKKRPQQTSDGSASRVYALDALWTEPQQSIFQNICGPEMEAFGYSNDESYWDKAEKIAQ